MWRYDLSEMICKIISDRKSRHQLFDAYVYQYSIKNLFNDKRSDISIAGRHWHCAEDAVLFPSGDDADIISFIPFQFGSSVFRDVCIITVGILISRLVPVPFFVGIGSQEYVITIAAIYNIPGNIGHWRVCICPDSFIHFCW